MFLLIVVIPDFTIAALPLSITSRSFTCEVKVAAVGIG